MISLSVREIRDSILRSVKPDTSVSLTARHYTTFCSLRVRSCVVLALSRGNGPRNTFHEIHGNTASSRHDSSLSDATSRRFIVPLPLNFFSQDRRVLFQYEFLFVVSKRPVGGSRTSKVAVIGAGSRVPGGAQAPPELFLAPPEPFETPLTIEKIMH